MKKPLVVRRNREKERSPENAQIWNQARKIVIRGTKGIEFIQLNN